MTDEADSSVVLAELQVPIFMPPTSEQLRGHIGLGLSVRPSVRQSVCPSVRPSVCPSVRNTLVAEKLKNRLC